MGTRLPTDESVGYWRHVPTGTTIEQPWPSPAMRTTPRCLHLQVWRRPQATPRRDLQLRGPSRRLVSAAGVRHCPINSVPKCMELYDTLDRRRNNVPDPLRRFPNLRKGADAETLRRFGNLRKGLHQFLERYAWVYLFLGDALIWHRICKSNGRRI